MVEMEWWMLVLVMGYSMLLGAMVVALYIGRKLRELGERKETR